MYIYIHQLFNALPELALFLSLGLGYWVGKLRFGPFQLGGVTGSLLMAIIVSQFNVQIDDGLKDILFVLFLYAVGFTSGPQFFRSLGKNSIKELILAACMAATGLGTVLILAKLFHLDKGLAAGIAAGGLTQSAIMGTAESAIKALPGISPEEIAQFVTHVSVGYGITYIFGTIGPILLCLGVLPKLMRHSIRDDALQAESKLFIKGVPLGEGEQLAVPSLVGRLFKAGPCAGMTVKDFEESSGMPPVTISRLKREGVIKGFTPDLVLEANDTLLLVGLYDEILAVAKKLGPEQPNDPEMDLRLQSREVVVTNKMMDKTSLQELRTNAAKDVLHGVYLTALSRDGESLPLTSATELALGDIITLYGTENDIRRVTQPIGYALIPSDKTDFVYLGFGLVLGLLIGSLTWYFHGLPLTLGSSGGALASGILFGWLHGRSKKRGNFPAGAAQLLKDLGLAGFVVVIGLNHGMAALDQMKEHGLNIFLLGTVVTLVPMLLTMLVGIYILRYKNAAVLAGALTGARSATPALGEVLNKAGNPVPARPFVITYALANVFLTLLGPLITDLV